MTKIFWDTNLFIYLLERHAIFSPTVVELRKRMLARGDYLYTSSLTVGEILVKPAQQRNASLMQRYRSFFEHPAITVVHLDIDAAVLYAQIRQDRGISKPDAIQLACAACVRTDLFITNDARLSGKAIEGIKFITTLANAPI